MNFALRPKSPLHFSTLFSLLTYQSPRCLSSVTPLNQPPHPTEENLKGLRSSKPNYELLIISALKDYSSMLLIPKGQGIHGHIAKLGLDCNIFIRNSLISFYSKCGLISSAKRIFDDCEKLDAVSCNIMLSGYVKLRYMNDARELFDKMPGKNCVSFTTMIMGLAQNGSSSEAIKVFQEMMMSGVLPNEVTMASVITAFLHVAGGGFEKGRPLHGLVMKLGLVGFVIVSTNLVHMYCLRSHLRDASRLFDEMPEKNVVSWNVMLNGYAKAGLVDLAREFFERIDDKDVVSWGTIIDGYVQVGRLTEALTLYREMVCTGLGPNEVMIVDIISACGQSAAVKDGLQFHAVTMKKGFDCYDFIQATIIHFYAACEEVGLAWLQFKLGSKHHIANWNALISGLIRNGRIDEARVLFDEMPERDVFSWSSMISGYSQNEQPGIALELFHAMVAGGVKPNEITMVSVLSAIATLGRLNEGRWAHEYICDNSIPLNDNLSAAVIDMYAKCGSMSSALEVFRQMKDKASDVSPWNAMICGSAMHGHAELALRIFADLQGRKIKLNPITFIGVLSACCHAGLVEVGDQHFKSMKSVYNLEPTVKHYGCMVDLLGRAGRLKEAEELIRRMPMKADVVIWGTLLAACRTHGDMEVGERAAENLARLEPSHGPSRVLLSNIYADAGRWGDAFLVRKAMQTQGLMRSPAYSGVI
ncbi:unnamed protein product [Coffea canephora]|uniref:Pentacotripeptide-repeat region of PRORP domain-containing protein n=2 Tax=Coffea TaxID=13442 RepID=A0A068TRP3_COFCA|nr:pentatricopeptide repeat-containing protein At5g19020, mitochondrial-like [Coffea arabica]XP_027121230.1 pentatricopeptide repeat-containing protein At5g19020, mitochondrial-like [Coffea arabica]CDO98985.1 unnamed protein product [Coffea canephora]